MLKSIKTGVLCSAFLLGAVTAIPAGEPAAPARKPMSPYQYPDISIYQPDLVVPVMTEGTPGPGKRVRATLPKYRGTDIHYSLYLPTDWKPDGKYPVIVEYSGNGSDRGDGVYRSKHGDISTGKVDGSALGHGLSGGRGAIWIVLPYVDLKQGRNATVWWGDLEATVDFCKEAVKTVCADFGGDPANVIICGFSRGALACNYIGLHDDEIAKLWKGFWPASHYDGARTVWPYSNQDRASALRRLERLGNRAVFVSHEVYDTDPGTYTILDTVNYLASTGRPLNNFRFQIVPMRNHSDRWTLCDMPARRHLRQWWHDLVGKPLPAALATPPANGPALSDYGYPDISIYREDLVPPVMTKESPAPGRRVRATLPNYQSTDVHYSLYLPTDWQPGRKYPVIVEYSGNGGRDGVGVYRSPYGDISTGLVSDSSLGFGLSEGKGAIWIVLPFVDVEHGRNSVWWWGDLEATVAFCKAAVRTVCTEFGGDPAAVLLCGFSRGAIACNYIGLHDDEIAGLWTAFFPASHYDGAWPNPYPGNDALAARNRLQRLKGRPVFASQEVVNLRESTFSLMYTITYLAGSGLPLDNFTFQTVPIRNHTDRWVLCDLPARTRLRSWWQEVLHRSSLRMKQ